MRKRTILPIAIYILAVMATLCAIQAQTGPAIAAAPAEMQILENAQHGFGMAMSLNDETVKEWPQQALRFTARHQWIPTIGG